MTIPSNPVPYKRYLIEWNLLQQTFMIKKDGFFIAWAMTLEEAKETIDLYLSK